MIVSEKLAVTMFCPEARVSHYRQGAVSGPSHNRWVDAKNEVGVAKGCFCIASKCMAWCYVSNANAVEPSGYCGRAAQSVHSTSGGARRPDPQASEGKLVETNY